MKYGEREVSALWRPRTLFGGSRFFGIVLVRFSVIM